MSQRTETRRRLVDPEKFTEKFEDILACMRKERLVVIIDNLDRCTPTRFNENDLEQFRRDFTETGRKEASPRPACG